MRITALNRGGLAVFDGLYDAHRHEAVAEVRNGETQAVVIEYPSPPTVVSTTGSGITASVPVISGNKLTLTLSAIQDTGRLDVTATVGGEIRLVRIRARSQNSIDRYWIDGDMVGP